MFYEGSEKRLEITCTLNLFELNHHFWAEMVEQAGAYIISEIKNEEVKAFLLSESSLFIWKHRLLLITCGETYLLQAALFFQKKVHRHEITSLLFQRHQALNPERQKTSFQQDSLQLQQHLTGVSQHWNANYCGDIFLFGNNQQPVSTKNIFMLHGLTSPFFDELQSGKVATVRVAEKLQLTKYFHRFTIDQYSFEPKGYSLNAISDEHYFTLHITPEKLSSYLSFESNLDDHDILRFHHHLITLFKPSRNALMTFTTANRTLQIQTSAITE